MGEDTITVTSSIDNDTFVINLNDTYGATTSYISNDSIVWNTVNMGAVGTSYTVGTGGTIGNGGTIGITDLDWLSDAYIEVSEVEKMCAEYPALAKVYENFKTMYDLVKQDWEGKKKC